MEEPFGPWEDDHRVTCHGCEVRMSVWSSANEHLPDCPGLCVRNDCPYHPKV